MMTTVEVEAEKVANAKALREERARREARKVLDEGPAKEIILTRASDIQPESVRWLWEGRIALGAPALIAGREAHGKSSIAYERIARLTRGDLPGEHFGTPKGAVIAATEDSWAHVIVPRLMAAGADLTRVFRVQVSIRNLPGAVELNLPEDVPALEKVVIENDVALILLDPVISRLGSKLDTHKDAEVRRAFEPLAGLCDRTRASLLGVIHVNKTATTDPLTAIMGSRAFTATARAVLFVVQDGESRLLSFEKNSYGPLATSQTFKVEGCKLQVKDAEGHPILTSRVIWLEETDRKARDVLEELQNPGRKRNVRGKAEEWLEEQLEEGPRDSRELKAEALKVGISEATLKRAARGLRVAMVRGAGFPSRTTWDLPAGHDL